MTRHLNFILGALIVGASAGAYAQTNTAATTQRDATQEKRIEQGLQNGSVTTREGALLQRDEAHVDNLQAQALKNGKLSSAERARINAAQNKASRDITTAEHNGVNGNPLSASSQRMQADVQRNENQQQRIANGVKSGSLTNHETGSLERGQAHVDKKEVAVARNGHVSAREQRSVQRSENHQSGRIHQDKTNAQNRAG